MSTSESRSGLVLELAEEFLERYRKGERPPLKEYIDGHPELAGEIREVFPAMAMMEKIALADDSLAGDPTGAGPAPKAPPLEQLGDYRILREIGRGGMGVVYEAEQVSLGRHVALKLLPRQMLGDAKQKHRFEREARSAAKLHHTNIVPVFGVGEHEETPYYVMQFIQGLGLDEVLAELKRMKGGAGAPGSTVTAAELKVLRGDVTAADVARSLMTGRFAEADTKPELTIEETATQRSPPAPSSARPRLSDSLSSSSVPLLGTSGEGRAKGKKSTYWQGVARIGAQVAEALEYAHKQRIIHRDIKPSNLLLDTRGTVWVTDFGLAKTDDQQNLTHTGDILGTLRYMPPEAFEGKYSALGDVYSLGLTLYELLAFRPAFGEKDRGRLVQQVTTEEPNRLRRLNPEVPRDLETIVHKAIERDPSHRYPTAGELTADLERFIDDEPIRARRTSPRERAWRWCRRNPALAGMSAALLAVLLAVAVGSTASAFRFRDMAGTLESHLYFSDVALAHRECLAQNQGRAARLLDGCPPHLRGWEWHYLKRQSHTDLLTIPAHDDYVFSVEYSPDGKTLATASQDGTVRLFDAETGRRRLLLPGHAPDICWRVVYSPDGTTLASAGRDKTVKIWDAASGKLIQTLRGHPGVVWGVDFSPDGRLLASSGIGVVKLWDTQTWREFRTLPGGFYVQFSPDGRRVASRGPTSTSGTRPP